MKTDQVANPIMRSRIQVVAVTDSLREFNEKIEEAKKLQRKADSLLPQLVRMIAGRLHHIDPKGFHSSSYHELLMQLKKELSHYNGQSARWEK